MAKIDSTNRTDSFEEKVRLLHSARASGNYDLAMSLIESLKDTVSFQRQLDADVAEAVVDAGDFSTADQLPAAWTRWAAPWSYFKTVALFETVGLPRVHEPVRLNLSIPDEQATDLFRELRVARVDPRGNALAEVPVQVLSDARRGNDRHVSILFFADVSAHEMAIYLVFYGNPHAELPSYETGLRSTGEGYGLTIENSYFVAQLSHQMGQLERLTIKRQHELQLYAGGKGHGEPPTIDWAHDYVDHGGFQKLRIKNWSHCPNFDVVKGPLCVQVRRWGFPHSPIHPVFSPSRMHVDQTYVFHAGLPYFLKFGTMEAIKELDIAAMRDDEWVFSGYSFTDLLWIDRRGKLHEGPVTDGQQENLWGVGFYHRQSRDSFIALWLEHSVKNHEGISHGGVPTLHYDGHGQLWSRYPAGSARLKPGASFHQKNAYVVLPFEKTSSSENIEKLRHQLANPLVARAHALRSVAGSVNGQLARAGETKAAAPLKERIWMALREVRDEQLYVVDANIVDMGYVYDVRISLGTVRILLTMPHSGRPEFRFVETQGGGRVNEGIRERLLKLNGVRDVVLDFTWEPAWTVSRLSNAGRGALGLPL